MNKYKLINKTTNEEHICEKVVVDGWDYYVSDETVGNYCWYINTYTNKLYHSSTLKPNENSKKVITTNNPNIDIPELVDEVDVLRETMVNLYLEKIKDLTKRFFWKAGFKSGYNKSQETHPFSNKDLKRAIEDFHEMNIAYLTGKSDDNLDINDFIKKWKTQQPKILYYE